MQKCGTVSFFFTLSGQLFEMFDAYSTPSFCPLFPTTPLLVQHIDTT